MSSPDPTILWNELAQRAGVRLEVDQHEMLRRYIDLLLEANQRMNLTRLASREQAAVGHIGDALTVLPFLPRTPHRLVDIGSGGGVPGIPLAIVRPDVQVVLVESTGKKAKFLQHTIETLELSNVLVDPHRAELVGQSELREAFDVAVARAVATLDWLAEWCLPLIKVGGLMLAMKGPKVQEEIPRAQGAIRLLGGADSSLHAIDLAGTSGHVVVCIKKDARTDPRYPRDPTRAKGKPLR